MSALAHERHVLAKSGGICAVDFRCREPVAKHGAEEPNPTNSIAFVRRGVFERTSVGRTVIADANHILFFNAAQPYRYAHPAGGGDDCTILTIATPVALQIIARHSARDADRETAPFTLGHAVRSRRSIELQFELLRNGLSAFAAEDLLYDLADQAVRDAYATHERKADRETLSPAARRRREEMTNAAKVALNEQLAFPPSLDELARSLGCSPFHLSRTFHAAAGVSLRRYLGRLRAGVAAHHLARGARNLTELALDLGYSDHSHFTNAFREELGVAPSRFRKKFQAGGGCKRSFSDIGDDKVQGRRL